MKTVQEMDFVYLSKMKSSFPRVKISRSQDAYEIIKKFYKDDIAIFESFFILLLDRSSHTTGYAKISQGGITGTVVDIKIIAKYVIDSLASGVILAHNHPSGSLKPSAEDELRTKEIIQSLSIFDCRVLDHLIITSSGYYSFNDKGLL